MATKTQHHTTQAANDLAVFTLVVWLLCVSVGALGWVLPYARPLPPASPDEPVLAQSLQVELTEEPVPPPDTPPPSPDPLAPPPPPDAITPPSVVQAIAVAQPSPAVAFALPVEGPTRVVEVKRAEHVRPTVTNASVVAVAPPPPAPSAQPLTFGEGEGRQPAPEYPRLSVRQGQEGVVLVRLSVDANGRVLTAEAVQPSPWPLLNQAALKVVRDRWHFRSGPVRTYEVSIRFELAK